jgi:membrane protease YdiL (CAAX protease family)
MTIQAAQTSLDQEEALARTKWLQRAGLFVLFLFCELAIFLFGSYYFDVYPTNKNLTFDLSISALFLAVTLWLKYDKRWSQYWQIALAFFIASVAYPFTAVFDGWIHTVLDWFSVTVDTSKGLAIEKVCEMLLKTVPIIALVKLSGADMGSIFLKRGNLKLSMGIGALVFFFLATASFMFAAQRFTSVDTLIAAVVWGLVFSIANGFMEELWLRGIFLQGFASVIGIHGAVWVTSLPFALMHGFVFYFDPFALIFFFMNTLTLGLACGYLMMKSDNLWGATLIHMASDFFLFLAVLASV